MLKSRLWLCLLLGGTTALLPGVSSCTTASRAVSGVSPVAAGTIHPQRFEFSQPHMGTLFRIVFYAADVESAPLSARAAFDRIAQLDSMMSDYRTDSELSALSRRAGTGEIAVSQDLFSVLEEAQKWARATNGAFDVTVGPVVRLWRRARRTGKLPSEEELERARILVGYQNLKLDPSQRTARLMKQGMILDLGGIAKGYAADQALAVLKSRGHRSILVAAGGDIAVADAPPRSKGWTVAVASADSPGSHPDRRILLSNAGVSTSGDAEQYVEIEGIRYSHVVDPRTGLGITGQRSATVIASDATTSDALSTALNVLGPGRGLPLIDAMSGTAALTVVKQGEVFRTYVSKNWKEIAIVE